MKDTMRAQKFAAKLVALFPDKFDRGEVAEKYYKFFAAGTDDDDREEALTIAMVGIHRRTPVKDIITSANDILKWEPPKEEKKEEEETVPKHVKKTTPKKKVVPKKSKFSTFENK